MAGKSEILTYEVSLVCDNCGHRQADTFAIPKGTLIWPATNKVPCENCGCTGILERKKRVV